MHVYKNTYLVMRRCESTCSVNSFRTLLFYFISFTCYFNLVSLNTMEGKGRGVERRLN